MPLLRTTVALLALATTSTSRAQTFLELREFDNSALIASAPPGTFPEGMKTFDLFLQMKPEFTQYFGAQVLLELDRGEIFDLSPDLRPPSDALLFASGDWHLLDTFVAQGGDRSSTTFGGLGLGAGPVNIDPALTASFQTSTTLGRSFNPAATIDFGGPRNDFLLFRFNVTPDARGTLRGLYGGFDQNEGSVIRQQPFVVPEPATAAPFALLTLVFCAQSERKTRTPAA